VPLVLHLLAPNMRAVQVTTDLAGFCSGVYQELRPGLSRRYPKPSLAGVGATLDLMLSIRPIRPEDDAAIGHHPPGRA